MPSISFMEQFAGPVERGEKLQTIRRVRKVPIKVGDRLYLFTGLRTKKCRKLGVGRCTRVRVIRIESNWAVYRDGRLLGLMGVYKLASKDGFADVGLMFRFFEGQYGLPFEGVLIEWKLLEAKSDA